MTDSGYSLADIAAATNNDYRNDGFGDGNGWWLILLFLFAFNGNGFGWGNNNRNDRCATTEDVQNQFNFAALERQNNEIVAEVRQVGYDNASAIKDASYLTLSQSKDIEAMVADNGYKLRDCCCDLNRNIDSLRFDNERNTCNIIQAIHCDGEETRKLITCNTIQDLRDRLQESQLQNSQCAQNAYLVNTLRPAPIPAVPYTAYYGYGYGYNNGCCGNNGIF